MLSGVHIICFAASYAIALALEVSRLAFRSRVRGAVMLGVVAAGWVAHSAFLYYRALSAAGSPLSSLQDWLLLAAWLLVMVYVYLTYYHPRAHFGVFLLPLVLGLIGVAALTADSPPLAREPSSRVWGIIHGTSILLATVSVLVGFAAGVMYLGQARRLKRRRPAPGGLSAHAASSSAWGVARWLAPLLPEGLKLPSLEWLQTVNSRSFVISLWMLGIGVGSGIVLDVIDYRSHLPVLPWNDPLVLATCALFLWLLFHLVLSVAYRPIRQGRRVAYLTVASFLFLVLALAMGFFLKTQHGPRREGPAGEGTVGQAHQSCSSTKSECRNPSQIRISKSEGAKLWGFGPFGPADLCSRFEFRVCFVFRTSDFGFAARGGGS